METTKPNKETANEVEAVKAKRAFISLALPLEKKLAIEKEANLVCGVTVTEYCLTKIFAPTPEKQEPILVPANEEEIQNKELINEELLKKINTLQETISKQAEELTALKVSKSVPGETIEEEVKEEIAIDESNIVIALTPDQRKIVDLAVKLESESFFGTNYRTLGNFIKKQLGSLISSNQNSFPDEYFEKDKPEYQIAFDFINYLKQSDENES